jgi:hypothetical protein
MFNVGLNRQNHPRLKRSLRVFIGVAFRRYRRSMLMAMLMRIGENTGFYMLTTFLVVYATQILKTERARFFGLNGAVPANSSRYFSR